MMVTACVIEREICGDGREAVMPLKTRYAISPAVIQSLRDIEGIVRVEDA